MAMLIYKTLAKFLVTAVAGAGIVCTTMHLTNFAGMPLNSLLSIDLKNKPEIPEDEIHPEEKQTPPESQSNSEQSDSEETEESSETTDESSQPTPTSDSQDTQSTSSTNETSGSADIKEVIKFYAQQITNKNKAWISNSSSLTNIHEIITSIAKFSAGVQQLSSDDEQKSQSK